jgi:hypothetical protein
MLSKYEILNIFDELIVSLTFICCKGVSVIQERSNSFVMLTGESFSQ